MSEDNYPKIPLPRVRVREDSENRTVASCDHCAWEYSNYISSDVRQQATWHRIRHREGAIAVENTM